MNQSATQEPAAYVVTDVELDGPSPLRHSMLSFGSVAVDGAGTVLGTFEAVLEPRPDRVPDPGTLDWWSTQPDAFAAATEGAKPPADEMKRFVAWVESLPSPRVFAARPLMLDGVWIDHYLDAFTEDRILAMPRAPRRLFSGSGVDLDSLAGALLAPGHLVGNGMRFSAEWLGNVPHTHRAIDDARGYANVLSRLLRMARERNREGATP